MPIYAYKCATCGHAQDVLQKISDAPLTLCPACGAATYAKQVTAAGFQLKGSGWYVTDFRDNGKKAAKDAKKEGGDAKADAKTDAKADGAGASSTEAKAGEGKASESSAKSESASPAPSPVRAPSPAPSSDS